MFGEWRAGEFEVGFEHLHGVAGASLLGLEDELNASGSDCGADAFRLMADDAIDMLCRDNGLCSGDDVEEKGATADFVENFWALAFQPRALACSHDRDGEA
jgi:hypothetical protein